MSVLCVGLILPTASVDGNSDCLVPWEMAAVVIIPCFQAACGVLPAWGGEWGEGGRAGS